MIMNVPNSLTVGRIVIVFIFLLLANVSENTFFSANAVYIIRVVAYILAIIAGITDLLDGYIARKYNQVTDFGALMDPLADKVFVTAAMLMMVEFDLMPAWIAVIVITREFLVTGLRMIAAQRGAVLKAEKSGKNKTFSQMVTIIVTLIGLAIRDDWFRFSPYGDRRFSRIVFGMMLITVALTLWSGISYLWKNREVFLRDA